MGAPCAEAVPGPVNLPMTIRHQMAAAVAGTCGHKLILTGLHQPCEREWLEDEAGAQVVLHLQHACWASVSRPPPSHPAPLGDGAAPLSS
jgi:hypothetical protein